jgi:hypothetical protein
LALGTILAPVGLARFLLLAISVPHCFGACTILVRTGLVHALFWGRHRFRGISALRQCKNECKNHYVYAVRQCKSKFKILKVVCAHYTVLILNCQVNFSGRDHVQNYLFERVCLLPYNIIIDRRETNMTDTEFFIADQELWYTEYVESELSEIFVYTNLHPEKFDLEDVPF